jgi:hypothetical protein
MNQPSVDDEKDRAAAAADPRAAEESCDLAALLNEFASEDEACGVGPEPGLSAPAAAAEGDGAAPAPAGRATCPSGAPAPKINLAALKRAAAGAAAQQAKQAVSRMFGDPEHEVEPAESPPAAAVETTDEPAESPPPVRSKQWLAVLAAVERATARVERVHRRAPEVLGWIGAFLGSQALLVILLAALGWI